MQEVLQFYEQLFTSMGENIEFVIVEVCEGDNTAGVNWHMGTFPSTMVQKLFLSFECLVMNILEGIRIKL